MAVDLTPTSSRVSIASGDPRRLGFKDKVIAIRNKASIATGDPTYPDFADSFGDQLSDLDGRHRWVLNGSARQIWDSNLRLRVGEVLRANEAEIYKGHSIQRIATVNHCWMVGYDTTCAHPTVIISCNQTTVLKRTMKVISRLGVLKDRKFLLKGIPFCDLRYRTRTRESQEKDKLIDIDRVRIIAENQPDTSNEEQIANDNGTMEGLWEDEEQEETQGRQEEDKYSFTPPGETTFLEKTLPLQLSMDPSARNPAPIQLGAAEIKNPNSGKPTTLGGYIMVDDVCFGLAAAHAFDDDDEDEDFGQRSISEHGTGLHLYDLDWANEGSSDNDGDEEPAVSNEQISENQIVQHLRRGSVTQSQVYESTTGELHRITAKSTLFSTNGLDWALCELGKRGKYAINGVRLPPGLRSVESPEFLLFKELKMTPPHGKIFVATKRGVVPGIGTGSDSLIKFGNDQEYRHVWSIELEESLSSGDSGSWVVDAESGDVYGMIVAGSTGLRQEYIIPAKDIGQDICRVMRADVVRLPTWEEVANSHVAEIIASSSKDPASNKDAIGWDSDESLDGKPLDEEEKRFLLAEILKNSSINVKDIVKLIKDTQIRPKWTTMALPMGTSLKAAQIAIDLLFADCPSRDDSPERDKTVTSLDTMSHCEQRQGQDEIASLSDQAQDVRDQPYHEGSINNPSPSPFDRTAELLDSNPHFRAEKSRRAWRAKRHADRGLKPHHRKSQQVTRNRKSGEISEPDLILQTPSPFESPSAGFESKFEMDSEDEQGNLEPDIIIVKHKGSIYRLKFPAFSIAEGSALVGDLRQQAAREFGIEDDGRVSLLYKGKTLKLDSRSCHEEGLKMRSEVLCVIQRTPSEELEYLSNKFHTELIPQGNDLMSNPPADADKADFEYKKISETILAHILLKSDAVETEGDPDARIIRKQLIRDVQAFLNNLDSVAKKDNPANWHADFLTNRMSNVRNRQPSPKLIGRPNSSQSQSFRDNENIKSDDDDDTHDVDDIEHTHHSDETDSIFQRMV